MSAIADALRRAIEVAHRDAEFVAACAGLAHGVELRLHDGGAGVTLPLVEPAADAPAGARVVIAAAVEDWARIACAAPAPGWHSYAALVRQPGVVVEGSAVQKAQALHALERWIEILRGQIDEEAEPVPDLSALRGAYARVDLPDGRRTVLYHERSGVEPLHAEDRGVEPLHAEDRGVEPLHAEDRGIEPRGRPALLMLHTAGADARQYHALMADAALQRDWSLHAFDMPAHGRSEPVPGEAWAGYRLTRQRYVDVCLAFVSQVLQRPVVLLGCSMGAAIALHLAREAPAWVVGVVALEAPLRSPGRRSPLLAHAQVNQAAHNPSYVRGLLAPQSPLAARRRAAWIYSQGGFGIYGGDLAFYSDEFDAERDVAGLDGRSRPIELLTGAYDHSATPADSAAVARLVPGAVFTEMPALGHFPMTEHPAALLLHLRPVLARVAARLAGAGR